MSELLPENWTSLNLVDLFDSTIQEEIICEGYINLRKLNVSELEIPKRFEILRLSLNSEDYERVVKDFLEESIFNSCAPSVKTALFEAIINAFQHGNDYNSRKGLLFAYYFNANYLEFILCDSGGIFNIFFPEYLKKLRKTSSLYLNWYGYSNLVPKNRNQGVGTSFIHMYFDDIKYFRSHEGNTKGGLFLYLRKKI